MLSSTSARAGGLHRRCAAAAPATIADAQGSLCARSAADI